ncbi:hypothetical protein FKP32DRAFT_294550 [Trametes sanguinea]|nr:hypothetical protein FKP32DRAFT_294550 [Trametes sanguinea]
MLAMNRLTWTGSAVIVSGCVAAVLAGGLSATKSFGAREAVGKLLSLGRRIELLVLGRLYSSCGEGDYSDCADGGVMECCRCWGRAPSS